MGDRTNCNRPAVGVAAAGACLAVLIGATGATAQAAARTRPGAGAADGFKSASTVLELALGESGALGSEPLLRVAGAIETAGVLIGMPWSGGDLAMLIVHNSVTLGEAYGVGPLELGPGLEEIRRLDATLIGTKGIVGTSALAVPIPMQPGQWAVVAALPGQTLLPAAPGSPGPPEDDLDGLPHEKPRGPDYGKPRPSDYCDPAFNCLEYAHDHCGLDPEDDGHTDSCETTVVNPGIVECWRAAGCRLAQCMWAVCWNERECECNWYKQKCKGYYDQFGEWPPPGWAPGTPWPGCSLEAVEAAACLTIYAAEMAQCLFP